MTTHHARRALHGTLARFPGQSSSCFRTALQVTVLTSLFFEEENCHRTLRASRFHRVSSIKPENNSFSTVRQERTSVCLSLASRALCVRHLKGTLSKKSRIRSLEVSRSTHMIRMGRNESILCEPLNGKENLVSQSCETSTCMAKGLWLVLGHSGDNPQLKGRCTCHISCWG